MTPLTDQAEQPPFQRAGPEREGEVDATSGTIDVTSCTLAPLKTSRRDDLY